MSLLEPAIPQGKLETEMQKQWRQQQTCAEIEIENRPVECIQLARGVKYIKNKRGQADEIKVQSVRSPRPLEKDESADQEVDQTNDFEISLMTDALHRGFKDDCRGDFFFFPNDGVCR